MLVVFVHKVIIYLNYNILDSHHRTPQICGCACLCVCVYACVCVCVRVWVYAFYLFVRLCMITYLCVKERGLHPRASSFYVFFCHTFSWKFLNAHCIHCFFPKLVLIADDSTELFPRVLSSFPLSQFPFVSTCWSIPVSQNCWTLMLSNPLGNRKPIIMCPLVQISPYQVYLWMLLISLGLARLYHV